MIQINIVLIIFIKSYVRIFWKKTQKYYDMKSLNDMNSMNDTKVNSISQCNLLHDKINPYKWTKNININYCPIIHGCMNAHMRRANFRNFRILLDSRCSYKIVTRRIVNNLKINNMMWYNGRYKRVTLPLIWKLKYNWSYLKLERRKLWHKILMWMTPRKVDTLWS